MARTQTRANPLFFVALAWMAYAALMVAPAAFGGAVEPTDDRITPAAVELESIAGPSSACYNSTL